MINIHAGHIGAIQVSGNTSSGFCHQKLNILQILKFGSLE